MRTQFYLVVTDGGSVKAVKNQPNLNWNEVAIYLNLELPQELFQKPRLQASIVVGANSVAPTQIDVETSDNIREAIESATGLEVRLEIIDPDE